MNSTAPIILAVEDEARNAALLRAVLKPAGYRLVLVDTLAAARAWLADARPDLVLLDVGLPDGNGLELARELHAAPATAELPIIVASAHVLAADQEAATRAGSSAFLGKPLRPSELLELVATHIGRDEPRAESD